MLDTGKFVRLSKLAPANDVGTDIHQGGVRPTLARVSSERPSRVEGGVPPAVKPFQPVVTEGDFDPIQSPLMEWLSGEWAPVSVVMNGQALPPQFISHGSRTMTGNEVKVIFFGELMVHAKIRLDETADPVKVDYFNLGQQNVSYGILSREGDEVTSNISAPGEARPVDFTSNEGSNRTLSRWRKNQP